MLLILKVYVKSTFFYSHSTCEPQVSELACSCRRKFPSGSPQGASLVQHSNNLALSRWTPRRHTAGCARPPHAPSRQVLRSALLPPPPPPQPPQRRPGLPQSLRQIIVRHPTGPSMHRDELKQ
ncbi:uncharacterized protein [Miscanthus floridulus]|uniref:uncharacterized protein n=1 Tax=Miscanthus floridulus TaxID=154761 RepID=UPI003459FCE2